MSSLRNATSVLLTRSLQTLSRLHVCATLALAQVLGSICVMVARATAPNRLGPSSVFPDAAQWDFSQGLKGEEITQIPSINSDNHIKGVRSRLRCFGLRLYRNSSLFGDTFGSTARNNLVSFL
jgi:hypothetical protein